MHPGCEFYIPAVYKCSKNKYKNFKGLRKHVHRLTERIHELTIVKIWEVQWLQGMKEKSEKIVKEVKCLKNKK